jgi:hypothetical protein
MSSRTPGIDNGHCDPVLPVEEKERLRSLDDIFSYR